MVTPPDDGGAARGTAPAVPWPIAAGAAVVVTALVARAAWLSDDAYITLRTVDNLVHGYGPRWNVAERVQAFTHPAWLLLVTPFYAITREAFHTVIVLQLALAATTVAALARGGARRVSDVVLAVALLAASKAAIEFSTSGLENALAHLLVVLIAVRAARTNPSAPACVVQGLLVSALLLCRLELGALVAPAIVEQLRPLDRRRRWLCGAGLAPVILWELFSLIYYGQLVPNTALAKLPPGVPMTMLAAQGVKYLAATWHFDPATILILSGGLGWLAVRGDRLGRAMAAGVALYVACVVGVGGDFMTGRFLTPALVLAVAGLVRSAASVRAAAVRWTAVATLAASALNPAGPLRTGLQFGTGGTAVPFDRYGVTDERRFYYPDFGWLPVLSGRASPARHANAEFGGARRARAAAAGEPDVVIASSIGVFGYYAGPSVHIIDRNALADPLLARLPPEPGWRPGHFVRAIPAGYFETVHTGTNVIEDPAIRPLYERVWLITRAPIWSGERWRAILGRPE